jgi:hypothetical protein
MSECSSSKGDDSTGGNAILKASMMTNLKKSIGDWGSDQGVNAHAVDLITTVVEAVIEVGEGGEQSINYMGGGRVYNLYLESSTN